MAIRVERNEQGNCVNFHGSSNPTYWNACLTAYVDDNVSDAINVVNDIITAQTGVTEYEFFQIPFTEFTRADNSDFANAQEAADYITAAARVIGVSPDSSGNDLTDVTVCFKLDDTSTSIILDNGYSFGVNTIKAVAEGGVIEIHSITGDRTLFSNLNEANVCINDLPVSGGLNDVVNTLNELFTVGAFTSVVISDPYSTMVADIDGTEDIDGGLVGSAVIDPIGNDIGGNTQTHNNNAGYLSDLTIDQAGEYFTFDIRGEGQIGFGLVHTQASYDAGHWSGNSTYANPASFCNGVNSSHYGYQFAHFFHPTPNGSWTNYGANTGYSMRAGWSNFNGTDEQADWLAGNPIKVRVGLDTNGYISIDTLRNGTDWVAHARTSYVAPEGAEFRLGIKFSNPSARLYSQPKVHLLEPAAPTMYFRYIESPDGVFQYPLFATEEEANYYDEQAGGSGTSHSHVYPDDPTNTTWYMPDTNAVHNGTSAPVTDLTLGTAAVFTEITSQTNADLAPAAFTDATLTVDELDTINYQTQPQDTAYTTTFTGLPLGLFTNAGTISGNAPEVTGYNDVNPSDTYTVTVTRTNSYGSSSGTLTIVVNNLTAPPAVAINGVTHEATSTALVDSDTLDDGSVVSLDNPINDGNRMIIDKAFVDNYVLPAINSGSGNESVWIGFGSSSADWSNGVTAADFDLAYEFFANDINRSQNNWRLRVYKNGVEQHNVGIGSNTSGLYNYLFVNDGGTIKIAGLLPSYGDASTFVWDASSLSWEQEITGLATQNRELYIGTNGTQLDLPNPFTNFTEVAEPAAPTSLTNWSKALDFSGSSERAVQVNQNTTYNALRMNGLSATVGGNANANYTTNLGTGRPWATAIVFSADYNNSNQHIWNSGEGAGSTDDNIYLRLASDKRLYFGWGRTGALNELYLGTLNPNIAWYGCYIASTGERLSGANATPANLAKCFDVRLIHSGNNFTMSTYNWSNDGIGTGWNSSFSTTGGRMDRSILGDFTVGGRGANRNFHGKVASMVVTTLKLNTAMPSTAEIELMITDPKKWEADYLVNNTIRQSHYTGNVTYSPSNIYAGYGAVQIWLMGDGTNDSYSNMIRNQVFPSDQNYTKLNLISMVSNDIENVTINGLS